MRFVKLVILAMACSAALVAPASRAQASLIPVRPDAFPSGSPLITFDGVAAGTAVNGLFVDNVGFQFTINGIQASAAFIDGGPGITNNITPPDIVSNEGNAGATLTVMLPTPARVFGYGYAINNVGFVPNATYVELFNGTTSLGIVSFDGKPDPTFTGGFAGVFSSDPFTSAQLTFSTAGFGFAVDNIRYAAYAAPEPASLVMGGIGFLGVLGVSARRRRQRSRA